MMAKGGARNRSGPQPDENSGRSDARDIRLTALPSEGYQGEAPAWPLAGQSDRELDLWAWVWTTPQACAWSLEPWRWHTVAMWVRTAALCESDRAQAADKNSLHRFADQVGLTPAGLKENGWKIASDELSERREVEPEPDEDDPRVRFAVVPGSGA